MPALPVSFLSDLIENRNMAIDNVEHITPSLFTGRVAGIQSFRVSFARFYEDDEWML